MGRRPVTEGLGLEAAGVATERGYVKVDAHQRTNVPGIYAIGDCTPTIWLAHVASAEGIVAAETIAGHPTVPINRDQVPGCTYCDPEVASIGLTEAKAKERGFEVKVGRFGFQVLAKSAMEHTNEGFVKIVSDRKYDEVLGVHIVGPHATELIGQAAAFMRCEATTEEMVQDDSRTPDALRGSSRGGGGGRRPQHPRLTPRAFRFTSARRVSPGRFATTGAE